MGLKYVVITSVDRDDLRDGGAEHFVDCIAAVRAHSPRTKIEILTPDFRGKGRMERALEILATNPPDVFNHNVETVPDLYPNVRPGADYQWSLTLLQKFKAQHPDVADQVRDHARAWAKRWSRCRPRLRDLRAHDVDMVTIGQYLQPSAHHHPVLRYWTPEEFKALETFGMALGFSHVASGPLVRSSYHADRQAAWKRASPPDLKRRLRRHLACNGTIHAASTSRRVRLCAGAGVKLSALYAPSIHVSL